MSEAVVTLSGHTRCGMPGGILPCGATANENRDDQYPVVSGPRSSLGLRSSSPVPEQPSYTRRRGPASVSVWEDGEDIDASNTFVHTLPWMNDNEVLASVLGQGHGAHRDFSHVNSPLWSVLERFWVPAKLEDETPSSAVDGPATVEAVQTTTAAAEAGRSWTAQSASVELQNLHTDDVISSSEAQAVMVPDDAQTPARRERTRAGYDENEAPLEQKGRVRSAEQQGSPTVSGLRLRAPLGAMNNTSSSTAATLTTLQLNTAAAAAPSLEDQGAAVGEPNDCVTNGADEMPTASLGPRAGVSLPAHQPCGPVEPSRNVRRSKRAAFLAAVARKRAAAAVRVVAKAVPASSPHGRSVGERGKASVNARV